MGLYMKKTTYFPSKFSFLACIIFATAVSLHGMNYVYKGYDKTKKIISKHPYATACIGAATAAGLGYYFWHQQHDLNNQLSDGYISIEQRRANYTYNNNDDDESWILLPDDNELEKEGEQWNNNLLKFWAEQHNTIEKQRNIYATTLQSAFRGYSTRKDYEQQKTEQKIAQNQAVQEVLHTMSHRFVQNTLRRLGIENDNDSIKKHMITEQDIIAEQEAIKRGAKYALEILKEKSLLEKFDFYAYINGYDKERYNFPPQSSVENYTEALRDLCSFFYFIGCEQTRLDHTGFEEGTFFIQDPHGHLKKFLENFITKTTINAFPKGEKAKFAARISTHKFGEKQYGINLWDEKHPWLFKFKHLLVGFNNNGIWMKPEKYGLESWTDWLLHGVDLACTTTVKIWSRFSNSLGDDALEYNKERVPQWEINEFKKLFPTCTTHDMTLGTMYTYAQQALQQEPKNAIQIKLFIDTLQRHYTHLNERFGREIRLTSNELMLAHMFTNETPELSLFLDQLMKLKHAIAQYQNGNYDYFKNKTMVNMSHSLRDSMTRKHLTQNNAYQHLMQQMKDFIREYHKISKRSIAQLENENYFTQLIDILTNYQEEKILQKEIADQQILQFFESDFHIYFSQQKQRIQQQQESILQTELLSIEVMDCLEKFKNNCIKTIQVYFPDYNTLNNTSIILDKKAYTTIKHQELRDFIEKYILDIQQTNGLRKTTELRIFAGEKYDSKQFINYNEPIIKTLYEKALHAHTEQEQNSVLALCKIINTMWQKILYQTIPALAEKYGKIFSYSQKGQEIIAACIKPARKQYDNMITFYTDIYKELENNVDNASDDWKKAYETILENKENSYRICVETIPNFCRIANSEEEFKDAIMQALTAPIRADLAQRDVEGNLEHDWITQSETFRKVIKDQNKGYTAIAKTYAMSWMPSLWKNN